VAMARVSGMVGVCRRERQYGLHCSP
jgi:hypothetical protein